MIIYFLHYLKFKSTIQQFFFSQFQEIVFEKCKIGIFFFLKRKRSFKFEILVHSAQNYYHIVGVFVLSEKWI